ncbi:hypothetical protein M513_00226 [Trichuris suis]|nr:hypothetical protein M513_00226 [Trichuris suis]
MQGIRLLGGLLLDRDGHVRFNPPAAEICAAAEAGLRVEEKDFIVTYEPATRSWERPKLRRHQRLQKPWPRFAEKKEIPRGRLRRSQMPQQRRRKTQLTSRAPDAVRVFEVAVLATSVDQKIRGECD